MLAPSLRNLPPTAAHTRTYPPASKTPSLRNPCTQRKRQRTARQLSATRAQADDDAAGAQALSGLHETAATDQLIDTLTACNSPQDLARAVGQNLLALDQSFWMRLATRADIAQRRTEKEKFKTLAESVMRLVDSMVQKTNEQLTSSSGVLQRILTAAADEKGEWEVPLPREQLEAMRAEMLRNKDALDEALLSNAYAWMRKSRDDNIVGMVALLQKVLQVYAADALRSAFAPPEGSPEDTIDELIAADEEQWDSILSTAAQKEVSEAALLSALQKKVEGVVLALPSGSYAQRVQAEYLKELEARTKTVFQNVQKAQGTSV